MESFIETTVVLKLTQTEAQWLKGLVQKAHSEPLGSEPEFEREIRLSFWNALKDVSS